MGFGAPYKLGWIWVGLVVMWAATVSGQTPNDGVALKNFRLTADSNGMLRDWTGDNPCQGSPWSGVICSNGRVFELKLEGLQLSGSIDALGGLDQLRLLTVKDNNLTGPIPDFSNWRNMQLLYLNGNQFTGPIPESVGSMWRLARLNLQNNFLNGTIPNVFDNLTRLQTLRLEGNNLTGAIPPINNSMINDFSVAGNQLSGSIPLSLVRFNASSFLGNGDLCGAPLTACPETLAPTVPPEIEPTLQPVSSPVTPRSKGGSRLSTGEIVAIVVGDVAALMLVTLGFLVYYWRRRSCKNQEKPSKGGEIDRGEFSSGQYSTAQLPDSEKNKLVFLEGSKHVFELEDLLRASAEMLGKGSFGTAYKAVLEDGSVVAVKRLKDVSTNGKKEFEQQMELIGKLKHRNIVPLRAYYYAKGEKLLVYDYQQNGSLYSLLHGNRGPGRTPLDWVTRLKIALGAARGLAYLHQECGSQKIPHGNIKSSNILLDKNYNACIADYGLALLMTSSAATTRMAGYRAPEHADTKRISQRADVYSFGVVLLELLTGKAPVPAYSNAAQEEGIDLPRWVHSVVREEWTAEVFDIELMRYRNIEEEMVGLLQVAMVCVSPAPEQRPKMSQVVKMIEDIRPDQGLSMDEEGFESMSQSPLSLEGPPPSEPPAT
ncbi:hypothetical protein R1sor_013926 [Riccia sorocarpa]|uniref:non-specific serine/threonine protein kinase n=1 Tax=Riccia sorocarpa TaxID=122646 RepID=A0ABD3H7Z5_9MARC